MGATLQYLVTGKDPEAISQSSPLEAGVQTSAEFDQIVRSCTALDLNKRSNTLGDILASLGRERQSLATTTTAKAAGEEEEDRGTTLKITVPKKEKMQA